MSVPPTNLHRFECAVWGDVIVLTFKDRYLYHEETVCDMGAELFSAVELFGWAKIVLDFTNVIGFSDYVIQKLRAMDMKVKKASARWVLCCMCHELYDLFEVTQMNQLFNIEEDLNDALASLAS